MATSPTTALPVTQTNSGGAPNHPGVAFPPPGTQPQQPNAHTDSTENNKSLHQKGRGKIPWSKDVWDRIDQAVETEVKRTRIGARFLPKKPVPPKTTSVPTDAYSLNRGGAGSPILNVDEGSTTRLNEYYVEFLMTPQQVDQEEGDFKQLGHSTAVTLATKAANTLAQAEDLIVFQGQNAITGSTLFTGNLVLTLGSNAPADSGLLNFPIGGTAPGAGPLTPAPAPAIKVEPVAPLAPAVPGVIYGPNTFTAVAKAYSDLQELGHYGPYALVLETIPYADTYAPLPATLTLTADRIKPLVSAGFFGTGTVPPNPPPAPVAPYYGVLVSLGGNTMDLVVGLEPLVAFMQEDTDGNFRFRVLQRFALRVKDPTSIVILQFN
ncbi:MAG: encapsulin [Acidobacteriaceae bacterium]|nr:encapsulin [Acidobacteriaceae bacterium]